TVTLAGSNDAPVAADDGAVADEAGGRANAVPGSDPSGNVMANDGDADSPALGETRTVVAFEQGGARGTMGSAFTATYGTLTLQADGSYSYTMAQTDPRVEALRGSNDTLVETFSYTVRDAAGATATATLSITLRG